MDVLFANINRFVLLDEGYMIEMAEILVSNKRINNREEKTKQTPAIHGCRRTLSVSCYDIDSSAPFLIIILMLIFFLILITRLLHPLSLRQVPLPGLVFVILAILRHLILGTLVAKL